MDRGGNGGRMVIRGDSAIARFPKTDGKGCPACGAIGKGGHGGYCPFDGKSFNEEGKES